jgi:hypothetical protein
MSKNLILKTHKVEDFGGIDLSAPLVISLAEYYAQGKNVVLAEGDQETGKSSWLYSLMFASGLELPFSKDEFVNLKDKKMAVEREFTADGIDYKFKATKSRVELLKFVKSENEWLSVKEPITTLKKLIGNCAVSPMFLKEKTGKEQVKWLRTLLNVSEETSTKEDALKQKLTRITEARRDANREYERLGKVLAEDEMYLNWEQSEQKYKEEKKPEDAKKRVAELQAKRDQFTLATQKLTQIENGIVSTQEDIDRLELELMTKKLELQKLNDSKIIGTKFVEDNKGIVQEYDDANEAYRLIDRYILEQSQWKAVQKKKDERDEFETMVQKLDADKDNTRQAILDVAKEGMPDIEGLEVITEDAIDGRAQGIYYNSKSLAQLSESELWGLFLQIWETQGINFAFIENVNALGSKAIDILNDLAAKGCHIFASAMDRTQKSIKITFLSKL